MIVTVDGKAVLLQCIDCTQVHDMINRLWMTTVKLKGMFHPENDEYIIQNK